MKKIKCPTFVIHGKSDSLISISHADKLAARIPDSIKYYVDGMGHDLSSFAINPIINQILNLIKTKQTKTRY